MFQGDECLQHECSTIISDVPVHNQSPGLKSTQMTDTQGAGEQGWWVRGNFFRNPYDATLLCVPPSKKK